jgi:Phage integrase, N-terminal SAM-like domain
VTHLRQIMLEELTRRNYAESTIHTYIHTVEHFSRHFHRSPDQLGPEHIRQYQAALFTRWKLAPNTVTQRLAALRFFYVQVMKRGWSVAETPYPKKVLYLPEILSQEEVARLIDAAEFPFHRILLVLADVLRSELIRRAPKVTREILDGSDVAAYGSLSVITTLEFLEHHFAKVSHRLSPYDPTLSLHTQR